MLKACSYFFDTFYLDTRSLAVFRIGLGMVIIHNLISLLPCVDAFFGLDGIFPLSLYYQNPKAVVWSFHALDSNIHFIHALFCVQAALALMLILGYRTQLACVLSWALAVSLYHRIYIVSFGGDSVLTIFLFWGMLLPLGASFSLDARLNGNKHNFSKKIVSIASFGFILQMICLYFVTGLGKTHPAWLKEYTAIYYVLKTHDFAKPFGQWLTQFPDLLMVLSFLTIVMERYGLFLLLIPFKTALFRYILIVSYLIFHLMIFLTMDVGWFPWIMIVLWAALIPSSFWDRFSGKTFQFEPGQYYRGSFKEIIAAVLIAHVIVWNFYFVGNRYYNKKWTLPAVLKQSHQINIDSRFMFFVPGPPTTTYRYYFRPVFENPDLVPKEKNAYNAFMKRYHFKEESHYRWGKFLHNLQKKRHERFSPYFLAYLVYYWNQKYPDGPKVKAAEVFYAQEEITFTGTGYKLTGLGQF